MAKLIWGTLLSVSGLLLLFACSPGVKTTPPSPQTQEREAALAASTASWQEQWEKTVAMAKKENSLVIYTSVGGETRVVLIRAFKEDFGMDIEWTVARAEAITRKLLTEHRNGLSLADIYMGGSTTITNTVKPSGILEPVEPLLILPDVLDPRVWPDGKIPFFDRERKGLAMARVATPQLSINTNLVKPGELKSLKDLLDPKWKGKLLMNDPTTTGAGLKWFSVTVEKLGTDYMRQLARQDPVILRDERQQVEWLAMGKYPVLIAPKSDSIAEFVKAGAPIARSTPVEGGHIGAGAAYLTRLGKPAHPSAQKVFINWILTKKPQTLFSQTRLSPSSRLDVPIEGLDPARIPEPGATYFNGDAEDFVLREPEFQKMSQEIFGPLLK